MFCQKNYLLNAIEDVKKLAENLFIEFPSARLFCFYGDLGAGKTTICKEMINILTSAESVTSPTFNIVQIYEGQGRVVYHYDLYRLRSEEEIFEIGLLDNLSSGYSFIEWPEIAESLLPSKNRVDIKISQQEGEKRKVLVESKK